MTTETVLTGEQIQSVWVEIGFDECNVEEFSRAIERAVLQSPEVQKMHKDAERYRYLRDVLRHENDRWERVSMWNHENIPPAEFDSAIDAAMEKKE